MKAQEKLASMWGVWLTHSAKNGNNYDSNLDRIYSLQNWSDFAYTWKSTQINDPNNFFIDPESGKYNKYEIDGEMKKIQSINFFKNYIEPKWEYGDNSKGGYFNFSLLKDISTAKVQQVYQNFVFMAVGSAYDICAHLIGLRIIDTTLKNNFRCRIQVWVNYQDNNENLGMLQQHGQQIGSIFKNAGLSASLKFFNIGSKASLQKTISTIETVNSDSKYTNNPDKKL